MDSIFLENIQNDDARGADQDTTILSYSNENYGSFFDELKSKFKEMGKDEFSKMISLLYRGNIYGFDSPYDPSVDEITVNVNFKNLKRISEYIPQIANERKTKVSIDSITTFRFTQFGEVVRSCHVDEIPSFEDTIFSCDESYSDALAYMKGVVARKNLINSPFSDDWTSVPTLFQSDLRYYNCGNQFDIGTEIEVTQPSFRAAFSDLFYGLLPLYPKHYNEFSVQMTVAHDCVKAMKKNEIYSGPIIVETVPRRYHTKRLARVFSKCNIFDQTRSTTSLPNAESVCYSKKVSFFVGSPDRPYVTGGTREEKFKSRVNDFLQVLKEYSGAGFFFKLDSRKLREYFAFFSGFQRLYYIPVVLHRPYVFVSSKPLNKSYLEFNYDNIRKDLYSNLCFSILRNQAIFSGVLFSPKHLLSTKKIRGRGDKILLSFLERARFQNTVVYPWVTRYRKPLLECSVILNESETFDIMVSLGIGDPSITNTKKKKTFKIPQYNIKNNESVLFHISKFLRLGLIFSYYEKDEHGRKIYGLTKYGFLVYKREYDYPYIEHEHVSFVDQVEPVREIPKHRKELPPVLCKCSFCIQAMVFLNKKKENDPNLSGIDLFPKIFFKDYYYQTYSLFKEKIMEYLFLIQDKIPDDIKEKLLYINHKSLNRYIDSLNFGKVSCVLSTVAYYDFYEEQYFHRNSFLL
jgi:hypothetical protein